MNKQWEMKALLPENESHFSCFNPTSPRRTIHHNGAVPKLMFVSDVAHAQSFFSPVANIAPVLAMEKLVFFVWSFFQTTIFIHCGPFKALYHRPRDSFGKMIDLCT